MKQHDYDKILYRLMSILTRLSDGEILGKEELAKEFNVSSKTIQRDFNERLMHRFPIERKGNGWKMIEGHHLAKSRAMEDILVLDILRTFSSSLGSSFAQRSEGLLNKLSTSHSSAFYTRLAFEDMGLIAGMFDCLEKAIHESRLVQFFHKQQYRLVKPYRVVSFDGYWYLLCEEVIDGKVKTFHLARMKEVSLHEEHFEKDLFLAQRLDKAINAWFNPNIEPYEVILEIDEAIKRYMLDHPIAPTQRIIQELPNGLFYLSLEITHEKEILSTIFKWMPHIRVIAPKALQERVIEHTKAFLEKQIML